MGAADVTEKGRNFPPSRSFECYMVNETALVNGSNEKKWYCPSIIYLPAASIPGHDWRTCCNTEGQWRLAALVPRPELDIGYDAPVPQNPPERQKLDEVFRSMYAYHPVGP